MLSSVAFKDGSRFDGEPDIGGIAEALLFYGQVHFVANNRGYERLLKIISPYPLLNLLESGFLTLHVRDNLLSVLTLDQKTGLERYDYIYTKRVQYDRVEDAKKAFIEHAGSGDHREAAYRFAEKID